MVSVDARTVEEDGITLVAATLSGGTVPTRVAVDNRLDGPVWPPRRMGKPEAGWDEDGYEGVLPPDGRVAIGYACPAPAVDPPLEIVATERVAEVDHRDGEFDDAEDVLRGLGTPAPPREAVPIALPEDGSDDDPEGSDERVAADAVAEEGHSAGGEWEDDDGEVREDDDGEVGETDAEDDQPASDVANRPDDRPVPDPQGSTTATAPEPVTAWLDVVEARIERAEPLASAGDVPMATEALQSIGSLDAARDLETRRRADAAHLREVATRANALAYRAERAAIPVDALDRLV